MRYVLVTVSRGIIDRVTFFDSGSPAVRSLGEFVKSMYVQDDDAVVFRPKGLVACAKAFLDENNKYMQNDQLMKEIAEGEEKPIYIIGNPGHPLGFMVASPDDPLGFEDPVEAVSELGQMRKDGGNNLSLYRVIPVGSPLVTLMELERCNEEAGVEDFDLKRIEEYVTR